MELCVINQQLIYPGFALFLFIILIIFVPRAEIRRLFWFSLLWGTTVDVLLIWLFRLLHFYQYLQLPPFDFFGAPMWLPLAWSPTVIIFIYFLPNRREWYYQLFYITFFAMAGVAIGLFFTEAGLLKVIHWHPLARFPVQFLWLYGALKHYQYLQASARETSWP